MTDYLYNDSENLRFNMTSKPFSSTKLPSGQWFIVIECEDKCAGGWEQKAFYCGLASNIWNEESLREDIREILHVGAKPYDLKSWLNHHIKENG